MGMRYYHVPMPLFLTAQRLNQAINFSEAWYEHRYYGFASVCTS